jgi:hypothetical protein
MATEQTNGKREIKDDFFKGFLMMNKETLRAFPYLSGNAVKLYSVLRGMVSETKKDDISYPGYDYLKEILGVSSDTPVSKALAELETFGLMMKQRKFSTSSDYYVPRVPDLEKMYAAIATAKLKGKTTLSEEHKAKLNAGRDKKRKSTSTEEPADKSTETQGDKPDPLAPETNMEREYLAFQKDWLLSNGYELERFPFLAWKATFREVEDLSTDNQFKVYRQFCTNPMDDACNNIFPKGIKKAKGLG